LRAIKDQPSPAYKQEVIIRPAKRTDAAAICRLLHELAQSEGRHSLQTEQTVRLDLLGKTSPLRLLVAQAEKEAVGLLCYYHGYDVESASYGTHLADLIVTESWRGQKIGTRLMSALAAITLKEGGEWVSWTVLEKNQRALGFYTGLGGKTIPVHFMAIGKEDVKKLSGKLTNSGI